MHMFKNFFHSYSDNGKLPEKIENPKKYGPSFSGFFNVMFLRRNPAVDEKINEIEKELAESKEARKEYDDYLNSRQNTNNM